LEVDQANPLTRLVGFNLGTAYLRARRLFKKRMAALELSPLEYFILALVGGKSMHQARISGGWIFRCRT
jgi:hypothetical protein